MLIKQFVSSFSSLAAALLPGLSGLVLWASADAAELTPLSYHLNWLPQAEHCGFFQAQATGLYVAEGLDVTLLPGGPDINVPILVAAGKVDLAMGSAFTTLNMANAGIEGVTIAAFLQKSPQTLVAHPDQGIDDLSDLLDKEIMVAPFSRTEFWQFLKAEHGFKDEQLAPYAYSAAPFLADTSAVQQGYITEDAFLLGAQMDQPPVTLLLADYGYEDYASTVFGMRPWLEENSALATAFVKASAAGWAECITGNYEAAMRRVMEINPDHSEALFHFKMTQMIERQMVTGTARSDAGGEASLALGAMTAERWSSFTDTMKAAGVYPDSLDPTTAYSLAYLP